MLLPPHLQQPRAVRRDQILPPQQAHDRLRGLGVDDRQGSASPTGLAIGRVAALNLILLASAMSLAAGTHNPFIYFRF